MQNQTWKFHPKTITLYKKYGTFCWGIFKPPCTCLSDPYFQSTCLQIVACLVYFTISCTGLTSPSESSTSLLLWFAGVWRTQLRRIWATTAFRSTPSAADTYVQSTTTSQHQLTVPCCRRIAFGHRAFSVAGPMVWNSLLTEFRDLSLGFEVFRRIVKTILFARY